MVRSKESKKMNIRQFDAVDGTPSITITLDWDIDFSTIKNSITYKRFKGFCKGNALECYVRRSSTGNTHAIIHLRYHIDFWTRILIRTYLRDDPFRIVNDLNRVVQGEHTDVLFDTKIITEQWVQQQRKTILKDIRALSNEYKKLLEIKAGQYDAGEWYKV